MARTAHSRIIHPVHWHQRVAGVDKNTRKERLQKTRPQRFAVCAAFNSLPTPWTVGMCGEEGSEELVPRSIGARGFEPPASASRTLRSNQAELRPVSHAREMVRAIGQPSGVGLRFTHLARQSLALLSPERKPQCKKTWIEPDCGRTATPGLQDTRVGVRPPLGSDRNNRNDQRRPVIHKRVCFRE